MKIMASGPTTSWQIDEEIIEIVRYFTFLYSKITADGDCIHEIKRCLLLGWKDMIYLDIILESQDITLLTKNYLVKAIVFPVVTYGRENWTIKKIENRRIDAFELWKTLESPLDCKEIKSVNPKGNQSWIFIGRADAEVEAPILWPPDVKSWLTGKDPDAGKDWGWEKRVTEDEMIRWHHQLNGHEFKQTPGDSGGQRSLMCFSPWGCKESDTT